jgi:hypothetical protein
MLPPPMSRYCVANSLKSSILPRSISTIRAWTTSLTTSNGSARGALSLTGADFAKYLESYVDELYDWADANRVWGEFVFPEDGAPAAST